MVNSIDLGAKQTHGYKGTQPPIQRTMHFNFPLRSKWKKIPIELKTMHRIAMRARGHIKTKLTKWKSDDRRDRKVWGRCDNGTLQKRKHPKIKELERTSSSSHLQCAIMVTSSASARKICVRVVLPVKMSSGAALRHLSSLPGLAVFSLIENEAGTELMQKPTELPSAPCTADTLWALYCTRCYSVLALWVFAWKMIFSMEKFISSIVMKRNCSHTEMTSFECKNKTQYLCSLAYIIFLLLQF